jgi:hypothetical protein
LTVRYLDIEGAVRVTISHPETDVLGVAPPAWYAEARNGTATATTG